MLMLLLPAFAEDGEAIKLDAAAVKNLQLEFTTAVAQAVPRSIQAAGTVKLDEKHVVDVTPRIDGVIVSDPCSLGDQVIEGDILCRLKSAELSEMISAYVAAEETMRYAAAAAEQERKLKARNLSSAEQLLEKEQKFTQAKAAHAKALQPLKLLEFTESSIHVFLGDIDSADFTSLDIKSPEDGEIIRKDIRRGAAVEHDETLFTIAGLSELWVDFYVRLLDVDSVKTGKEVMVESSISHLQRKAKVIYVSPVADDHRRAVLVRAVMDNQDGTWSPGTPVCVFIESKGMSDTKSIAVPNSALVDFHGGKAVFVKKGDAAFVPVMVETGASNETMTAITSGLEAWQIVVSRNAAQLKGHLEMTAGE